MKTTGTETKIGLRTET